jgi:hypothetical protein
MDPTPFARIASIRQSAHFCKPKRNLRIDRKVYWKFCTLSCFGASRW